MSEGRRIGAGWIAGLGLLVFLAAGLVVLRWRHARLMEGEVRELTKIASGVEMMVTPGSRVVYNVGEATERVRFFGETRHEWIIGANSHAFSRDGRTKTARVRLICGHAPLSPGAPRITIVDEGAPENARYLEPMEAMLRQMGWSYGIIHSVEVNGTGGT